MWQQQLKSPSEIVFSFGEGEGDNRAITPHYPRIVDLENDTPSSDPMDPGLDMDSLSGIMNDIYTYMFVYIVCPM